MIDSVGQPASTFIGLDEAIGGLASLRDAAAALFVARMRQLKLWAHQWPAGVCIQEHVDRPPAGMAVTVGQVVVWLARSPFRT